MAAEPLFESDNNDFLLSTPSILTTTFVVCLLWYFSLSFRKWYQVRKVRPPGPIGLPLVGYLPFLGAEPHKTLWKMKQKYGDVISVYLGNKYTIIINDYEIAKELYNHSASLDRAQYQFDALPCIGFQVENGDKWVEQRRFCLSATRDLGLGRGFWEEIIEDEVSDFTEELKKIKGVPTDTSKLLVMSVASNIMSMLIGRKLNKVKEAEKIKLAVEFAEVAFIYLGPSEPASLVPGLRKTLEFCKLFGYDRAASLVRKFGIFVRKEISHHKNLSEFSNMNDFINSYLKKLDKVSGADKKHYFSEFMLEGNLTILFLGATDTIYSSLQFLMRFMAEYQDIQEKVYTELMNVLGKEGKAKYAERDKIPYTFAALMESQRRSSIVPLGTTRVLPEDIELRGFTFPKGAEISGNFWGIHHDPKYWEHPEEFRPERFLTENNTKLIKNPSHFIPFSMGRRNCPGEFIAWKEILGYFTEIVKQFQIALPKGVKASYETINGLTLHLKPQPLSFIKRIE